MEEANHCGSGGRRVGHAEYPFVPGRNKVQSEMVPFSSPRQDRPCWRGVAAATDAHLCYDRVVQEQDNILQSKWTFRKGAETRRAKQKASRLWMDKK
jgi:hypothetical protein